ncbi:hypothetical protein AQZ52_14505 [Novosphingobium fuchskuhlense]|uniref:Peptidase M48 domain-containing protein n=2 Tax=Novosphingobium fuchskuhlense TaxID=1117702 RepID=A0A117USL7_9SPHN|nr:hypothetical protein AQZ52_14505 [Novosphingobium fuchskuhlense]
MEVDETERRIRNSPQLITDPDLHAYIRSVLCRTVGEARCGAARLYIVRTPEANASMAPNGMMQINSGMLLHLTNEAQLAAVLGHEFAHYEHRHALLWFQELKSKGNTALWLTLTGIGLLAVPGIVSGLSGYSRDMEREADIDSLARLSAAGYSLSEISAPWKLFRAEWDATAIERKRKSHTLKDDKADGSHPSLSERIAYTEAEAAKQAPGAEVGREPYRAALARWLPGFLDDQIKLNDFGASDVLIGSLAQQTGSAALLVARGDLYRTHAKPGDLEKAEGFYADAIAASDAPAEAWRGRGLVRIKLGRVDEGKADLRSYIERNPAAPDRAMMAMMIGDKA